jgi:NADPH:quinone reductase-like Zn-dependent oxidoreductase
MKAYVLAKAGFDGLTKVEREVPQPAANEVLIEVEAASLNYRDLGVIQGHFGAITEPITVLSDFSGRITGVGSKVSRFALGDRVSSNFLQDWVDGPITIEATKSTLFLPRDGVLAAFITVPEHALVKTPSYLSPLEAATLPIAGVTAWSAIKAGRPKPGDAVLIQGTGGVSLFALQIAKALGLRTIVTSSSDTKLARAKALGADVLINYRSVTDWPSAVLAATVGRGVDLVVDVGGTETFAPSIRALALNGVVSSVGVVSGLEVNLKLYETLIGKAATLRGIRVGSRTDFEELIAFVTEHKLHPVIDRVFGFDELGNALNYLHSAQHFGKVVIDLSRDTTA